MTSTVDAIQGLEAHGDSLRGLQSLGLCISSEVLGMAIGLFCSLLLSSRV